LRKMNFGRQLSRSKSARRALFRQLVVALVARGSIKTTQAKAKAVQPMVEKMMTKVVKGDLTARRQILAMLGNQRQTVKKLFEDYQKLAGKRKSGFTRIIKLGRRQGDQAQMVRFEFVGALAEPKKSTKKEKTEKTKTKSVKKVKKDAKNTSTKSKRS
jgi:large subunit ribosomal protein L17